MRSHLMGLEGITQMPESVTTTGSVSSASPESLDEVTRTTTPHGWWALWVTLAALGAVLVWSFVGLLPQQVSAVGTVSALYHSQVITAPTSGIVTLPTTVDGPKSEDSVIATIAEFDGGPTVDVLAGTSGRVTEFYVEEGQGVQAGDALATLVTLVDTSSQVKIVTFVPATIAETITKGDTVQVTVSSVSSNVTTQSEATIDGVGESPSSLQAMLAESASQPLAQQWLDDAGGFPYRILLTLDSWPDDGSPIPIPGEIVEITNTYAYIHPIDLLFGGNE